MYCPGDVHWARLEASALGSLIAACPAWKRREREGERERETGRCGTFGFLLEVLDRFVGPTHIATDRPTA